MKVSSFVRTFRLGEACLHAKRGCGLSASKARRQHSLSVQRRTGAREPRVSPIVRRYGSRLQASKMSAFEELWVSIRPASRRMHRSAVWCKDMAEPLHSGSRSDAGGIDA